MQVSWCGIAYEAHEEWAVSVNGRRFKIVVLHGAEPVIVLPADVDPMTQSAGLEQR